MSNDGVISIIGNTSTTVSDGNNSLIIAGNGNDTLTAGANSVVVAGNGNDKITVGSNSAIVVGNGNDTLTAGANSLIAAGNGNDTIYLGANDLVAVGNGKDTFVIPASGQVALTAPSSLTVNEDGLVALAISTGASGFGFGNEAIFGFNTSKDVVQFNTAQFANLAAVMASAKQVGDDTVITGDAADTIVLDDVRLSSLAASDFAFVNNTNISVKISGIPAGVTLSDSAGTIAVTNGSATLTQAQLAGLTLKAGGVTSATLTVTATDAATGNSISKTIALSVNAVAPTLATPASLTVNAGSTIALGITETPYDPRDIVSLTIKGVPADAILSAGTKNSDGSWTLTPAQLSALTLQAGATTAATLTVTATNTLGQTASTQKTIQLNIVSPLSITFDTVSFTDSGVQGDHITNNGSVTLSGTVTDNLTVSQVQVFNGGTLLGAANVDNAHHTWSLTKTLVDGTYNQLVAKATDTAGKSASASTTQYVQIDTAPPTAVATVTALSADTGSSATDFITDVASQTVTGKYTGTLDSDEKIQVSTNGTSWIDASASSGNWSASGVTLANGAGTIQVRVVDIAGNVTAGTGHSYTLDTAPPTAVATVTALSADTGSSATDFITDVASQTVSGKYTGTLDSDEKLQVSANGTTWIDASAASGTWSASGVTLVNGTGAIQVRIVDIAGNVTAGTGHSYTLDTAVPTAVATVTGLSADTGSSATDFITDVASQTVSGTYAGTLDSDEKVQVSTNGTSWIDASAASGTWSTSGVTLANGAGTIQVRTIDIAGNVTAGTGHSYTLDTAAPTAVATVTGLSADTGSSATDFITDVASQTVSGTYAGTLDSDEKVQVSTNGTSWIDASAASGTWSASSVTLPNGAGTIQVRVVDIAGNVTTGTGHSYTLDTTAPTAVATVTALSADAGSSATDFLTDVASQTVSGTYTGTLDPDEKLQVSTNGTSWIDASASSGTWSASGVTLANGAGMIQVRSVDIAGNVTVGTGHSYTLDTTAPTVSISASITGPTNVTSELITVNAADANGVASVVIDDNGNFLANATQTSPGVWSYAASGLGAGGHDFTAVVTDNAGNPSSTGHVSLLVDTIAPTVSFDTVAYDHTGAAGFTKDASVTLSGTTSDNVTVAQVQVYSGAQLLGNAVIDNVNHTWTLTENLSPGVYTNLSATATDEAGNTGAANNTDTTQTLQIDTTPPSVTFSTVSFVDTGTQNDGITGNNQVTLSGSVADNVTVSQVQVFSGTQLLGNAVVDNGGHWTLATNLADGTYGNFSATATDEAGNSSSAGNVSAVQSLQIDTAAPTITFGNVSLTHPADASGTVSNDGIVTLSGTVADNVSVFQVQVFNGAQLLGPANVINGAWSLTTTLAQGSYNQFHATATDEAGNTADVGTQHVVTVSRESGYVADGYIQGATVFADTVGDGQFHAGEASGITDATGHFVLGPGTTSGPLVMTGGIDTATKLAFTGVLTAPSGSTQVTPLTTLVQSVAAANGGNVASASQAVATALGIDPTIDLTNLDTVAAAYAGNSQAFVAASKVLNTVSMVASAVAGTGASDFSSAASGAFSALATQIAAHGTLDLNSSSVVSSVVGSTLASVAGKLTLDQAAGVASVVTSVNQATDQAVASSSGSTTAALLTNVSATSIVAQGSASSDLQQATSGGANLSTVVANNTGTSLTNSVGAAVSQVGSVAPAPPTVLGLTPTDASPNHANLVHYLLAFSDPVTGVSASDFNLATTGLVGAAITGVTAVPGSNGTQYSIAINAGAGDGTLTLSFTGTPADQDLAGRQLADQTTHTGPAYAIDQDTSQQSALSLAVTNTLINSTGSANFSFAVGGLESEDSGTVTFTDGQNTVSVNVSGAQANYTANLSTLSDGPITSLLSLNSDAAGNSFTPVAGTSAVALSGFNINSGVRSNGGTVQVVQNGVGDVTLNPSGSVVAQAGDGVIAEQSASGTGNIVVNATGSLTGTGTGSVGLFAENLNAANNGNITIAATGGASGGSYGIDTLNDGNGNIAIESASTVTASVQYGIRGLSYGAGSVSIVTDAGSAIHSGSSGIVAVNRDTVIAASANSTITVTANGTINSGTTNNLSGSVPFGIGAGYNAVGGLGSQANTNVNGTVVVNNNANITAAAGYGIDAYNYGNGNVTVNDGAGTSVSGAQYGIGAFGNSLGTGNVTVNVGANATITGSSIFGIQATENEVGSVSVTTSAGDVITSGSSGINVNNQATSILGSANSSVTVIANGTIHSGSLLAPNGSTPGGINAGYFPGATQAANNNVAGNVLVQSNATIVAAAGFGIGAYNYGTGNVTVTTGVTSSITAPANGIQANALDGGNTSVTNAGSIIAGTGLFAGANKAGNIAIENDGQVTATGFSGINVSQNSAGSTGSTTITNTGTVVGAANHSAINVNENATGTVTINNSGTIGPSVVSSSSPAVTENGGHVIINNSGVLNGSAFSTGVGTFTGTLNNNAGATWNTAFLADDGNIIASGTGSSISVVTPSSGVSVGNNAVGNMTIEAGAMLTAGFLNIGSLAGSTGTVTVTGAGSEISNTGIQGGTNVGFSGNGTLTLSAGAALVADFLNIGQNTGSQGAVTVTGAGSSINTTSGQFQNIAVGFQGSASLTIANQATVNTTGMDVGINSVAGITDTLDINGGALAVATYLTIGDAGTAVATIENGGTLNTGYLTIGNQAGSTGSLMVSGAGSLVQVASSLNLFQTSTTLSVDAGAIVDVNGSIADNGNITIAGGTLKIANFLSGTGTITMEAASTAGMLELGGSVAENFAFTGGNNTVQLDNGFSGTISGISTGAGTSTITGAATIWATSGDAIDFTASGGTVGNPANIVLSPSGSLVGPVNGIDAVQNAVGDITISPTASVQGQAGDGVIAEQSATGTGNIFVNASGSLTGTGAGSDGLLAENLNSANGGNISVAALGGSGGGAFGIEILTQGNGNISLEAGGAVSAGTSYGVRVRSFGTGSETVTTDAGSVTTSGGTGLNIVNVDTAVPGSANSTITVTNNGTINSGTNNNIDGSVAGGIYAGYRGIAPPGVPAPDLNVNGTVVVNNNGNITAAAGYGIDAYNWGNGNVTVNDGAGTSVSGARYAIAAFGLSHGTGDVAVNVAANATLSAGSIFGIQAFENDAGSVSVTTSAGDTITSGSSGINAQSQATSVGASSSVTVIANGTIHSGAQLTPGGSAPAGIAAGYSPNGTNQTTNNVAGNVLVQSNATIVAAAGAGINAYNFGTGNVTVTTGAASSITAPGNGIQANALNGGNVSVTNAGSVTGGTGLFAGANQAGNIFIENDGQITATGFSGINVSQNSAGSTGSTTITNTGTVVGAANHSAINVNENVAGTVTINNSGIIGPTVVTSSTQVISETGGTVIINNNGQINGSINTTNTGAFTGTLNNNAGATWQAGYIEDEGTITASGAGSAITIVGASGGIDVANTGTGNLTIAAGAAVTADFLNIGQFAGGHGTVNVTGAGTTVNTTAGQYQNIEVGFDEIASLTIANHAVVTTTNMGVAANHDVGVTDTLDVNNATLNVGQGLTLGDAGTANATVENGGAINASFLTLANQAGSVGSVTVDGAGSVVTTSGISFGSAQSSASLAVTNGGAVDIGAGTTTIAGAVHVGSSASLQGAGIINGNLVDDGNITATGLLKITGTLSGTGSVTIDNGATLELGGSGAESIFFAGGGDTLQLDNALGFAGTIAGTSSGAGNFTVTGPGNVTAASGDAIDFTSSGGAVGNAANVLLSPSGAITGAVNGINVIQNGVGDITLNPSGSVVGQAGDGVIAEQSATGTGNIVVNASGSLTGAGAGSIGLFAENLDAANNGNMTIAATGGASGGQHGILAITQGNGNISIESAGAVASTVQFGIRAQSFGTGNMSVVTDAGSTINSGGSGINVVNSDAVIAKSANSTITVTNNASIHSGTTLNPSGSQAIGIVGGYFGANASANTNINSTVTINNNGNVTAAAGYGIQGYTYGNGDVTVNQGAGTSVSGVQYAIGAYQNSKGTGNVAVNVGANVTLTTGLIPADSYFGVQAFNSGVGNVSVTTSSGDSITAGSIALNAQSQATSDPATSSVTVIANGTIHSGSLVTPNGSSPVGAISAGYSPGGSNTITNSVAGNVTVQSNATVVAAVGAGINAYNYGTGNVTVATGVTSSITAPGNAIQANAFNGGNISLTNGGSATGATGLFAAANNAGTVTIENDGQVTATGFSGINVNQNTTGSTGSTTITNTGTVVGAANHSSINVNENAFGTVTINNTGTIGPSVVSSSSPAITENGGTVVINNTGVLNGSVFSTGVGTFTGTLNNNAGATWNSGFIDDEGTITASGLGSAITLVGTSVGLVVGNSATGSLTIAADAMLTASFLNIGNLAGSHGTVNVTGPGTTLTTTSGQFQNIQDGNDGTASLTVANHAVVTTTNMDVAIHHDVGITDMLDVNNATLNVGQGLTIGDAGTAHATVENGGAIDTGLLSIANQANGAGSLTIDGAGSVVETSVLSMGFTGGAATLSLTNGGALDIGTGTSTIAGAVHVGSLASLQGAGVINGNLVDDGNVTVAGGTLDVTGTVAGSGSFAISNGAQLEFGSSVAAGQNINFQGTTGTLKLDDPSHFSGQIFGLSGSDGIDLAGFDFGSINVTPASTSTSTILTVTDATHLVANGTALTLNLQGDYTASTFTPSSDGHGGVLIVDPPKGGATVTADATNQTLTGTGLGDTFVFNFAAIGQDTIVNFHADSGVLQFKTPMFANAQAVLDATHDDGHGNTVIAVDAHDSIMLNDVTKTQLHLTDFHIV